MKNHMSVKYVEKDFVSQVICSLTFECIQRRSLMSVKPVGSNSHDLVILEDIFAVTLAQNLIHVNLAASHSVSKHPWPNIVRMKPVRNQKLAHIHVKPVEKSSNVPQVSHFISELILENGHMFVRLVGNLSLSPVIC